MAKKLYYTGMDDPDIKPVTFGSGAILKNKSRHSKQILSHWFKDKGAALGHSMSMPKHIKDSEDKTNPQSNLVTGYCLVCGLPAKAFVVSRKAHAILAAKTTVLAGGKPIGLDEAPAGTMRYLFRGDGPAFRTQCPGHSARKKRPAAAMPKVKRSKLTLIVDMASGRAWVTSNENKDIRFEVEVILGGNQDNTGRFNLSDIMTNTENSVKEILLSIRPALIESTNAETIQKNSALVVEALFNPVSKRAGIAQQVDAKIGLVINQNKANTTKD